MPHDLSSDDLVDVVRDQYSDTHGDTRHIAKSAAWDAAMVTLALQHIRLAKSAVQNLAHAGDLSITMESGADGGDEMVSLTVAEEGPTPRWRRCGVCSRGGIIMAARPTWEGHLRLSLVTCPVALYKATESKSGISFNLINPATNSRIRMIAHDASTGEEVDRKSLVKGYEIDKGKYVLIDPEDIDALKIESTKTLDIEHFVDAGAIDRIYWDEPYYLVPAGKTGAEAFAVILEAMRAKGKVALGRLVMSSRERVVALEPRESRLLLTTLRTHDEVRDADDATGDPRLPKPAKAMLDIAQRIIEQQAGTFDPAAFTDRYEDAVREMVERKSKGAQPVMTSRRSVDEGKVVDLMDALRRSIGVAGKANDNRPAPTPTPKPKKTRRAA